MLRFDLRGAGAGVGCGLDGVVYLINRRGYFPAIYTQVERTCPIDSEWAWVVKANITKRLEQSDGVWAIAGFYASHGDWM